MGTRYEQMLSFSIVYTVFWTVILIFSMMLNSKKHGYKISTIFLVSIMIILTTIRCNSGSDYYNYFLMFNEINLYFESVSEIVASNFQFGYPLLCFVISKFTDNPTFVFFVISSFSILVPMWFINKYSPYKSLSYMILILGGYLIISTNILKQIIAMSVVMIAIDRFIRKKYISFVLYIIIASFFHVSTLVVLPAMFFIKSIKISKKFILFGSVISIVVGFLSSKFLPIFIRIPIFSRYQRYFTEQAAIGSDDIKLILNAIFMSIVLMCIVMFIFNQMKKNNGLIEEDYLFLRMLIIALFISIISINFFYLLRISFFFSQFLVVLIPRIIMTNEKKEVRNTLRRNVFLLLILFSVIFVIISGENNYYNYSTIFNDIPMSVTDFVMYGGQ